MTIPTDTDPVLGKITLQAVRDASRRVCDAHPDRINPMQVEDGDSVCLYTDPADPSLHCLGGQVLLELGCRLPMERRTVASTPDRRRFEDFVMPFDTGRALGYLVRLQAAADRGGAQRTDPADPSDHTFYDRRLEWRDALRQTEEWFEQTGARGV